MEVEVELGGPLSLAVIRRTINTQRTKLVFYHNFITTQGHILNTDSVLPTPQYSHICPHVGWDWGAHFPSQPDPNDTLGMTTHSMVEQGDNLRRVLEVIFDWVQAALTGDAHLTGEGMRDWLGLGAMVV